MRVRNKRKNREDYLSPGTWLNGVKHGSLWRSQLEQLENVDTDRQWDMYQYAKKRIREVQGGVAADVRYFYTLHPKRVLKSIEELWQFPELSMGWLKIIAIYYLTMELVENKCLDQKN